MFFPEFSFSPSGSQSPLFIKFFFQEYRFPESGEISYGDQTPNPIETDDGEIRADPINDDETTEATEDDGHSNPGEEENPEEKGGNYF